MIIIHPDNEYILNLADIEGLAPRVRSQLNQFLLTGEASVGGIGETDLEMPENLKIICSINENSVLKDGAFYERFIREFERGSA